MSYTETHFGKLVRVDLGGKTLEQFAERYCDEKGYYMEGHYKNFLEIMLDQEPDKFIKVGDHLYEIFDHEKFNDEFYFAKGAINPDGSMSFSMQFHNGGTCFSEMLEELVKEHGV